MLSRAELCAKQLLEDSGIDDINNYPISKLIQGRGAYYEERPLNNSDGRIVFFDERATITINSSILFDSRKRFAAAHELGHFEMHKNLVPVLSDTEYEFVNWFKVGPQEKEANEFAAELLMPSELFSHECKKKIFGPEVIDHLSRKFSVSKTAAILNFVLKGNHPICVIYCSDNKMKWFKASKDFRYFLNFNYNFPPPNDSVAFEMFTTPNRYFENDQKQQIWKSTWLQLNKFESDKPFFEYCLHVSAFNYSLSIIWEK